MSMKKNAVKRPTVVCGPSLTKQEFGERSDINNIVARYKRTGMIEAPVMNVQPVFADVASIPSFHEMLGKIQAAKEAFASLDPKIRSRFENEPSKLVEFIQNPANHAEAVTLGLMAGEVESAAPAAPAGPAGPSPAPKP